MKKCITYARYCSCGVFLELTSFPLYGEKELEDIFRKHELADCVPCDKKEWARQKRARSLAQKREE